LIELWLLGAAAFGIGVLATISEFLLVRFVSRRLGIGRTLNVAQGLGISFLVLVCAGSGLVFLSRLHPTEGAVLTVPFVAGWWLAGFIPARRL
jgi:hypothetical protein